MGPRTGTPQVQADGVRADPDAPHPRPPSGLGGPRRARRRWARDSPRGGRVAGMGPRIADYVRQLEGVRRPNVSRGRRRSRWGSAVSRRLWRAGCPPRRCTAFVPRSPLLQGRGGRELGRRSAHRKRRDRPQLCPTTVEVPACADAQFGPSMGGGSGIRNGARAGPGWWRVRGRGGCARTGWT